jgi:gamma-glutamyltranspeptidase/glutathione hydrolase
LLRDHGTKPLREVLGYGISYARGGFPVVERISATVAAVADLFAEHWPTSAALWLPGGRPPAVRYANPTLADTWERLLAEAESATGREAQIEAARRAWSQGFVAEAVDSFCRKADPDG